jgi:hypothetical protein
MHGSCHDFGDRLTTAGGVDAAEDHGRDWRRKLLPSRHGFPHDFGDPLTAVGMVSAAEGHGPDRRQKFLYNQRCQAPRMSTAVLVWECRALKRRPLLPDREGGKVVHSRRCSDSATIADEEQYLLTYHLVQIDVLCKWGSTKPHAGHAF